jgi:hypothetical protein
VIKALLGGLQAKLLPIGIGVIVTLALSTFYLNWRLESVKDQRDAAKAELKQVRANEKVVTRYVEKIVEVPGRTVIRDRLASSGVCHVVEVPGAGDAAEASASDAVAGRGDGAGEADRAAESLRNAKLNQIQCEALLEVVRPQVRKK